MNKVRKCDDVPGYSPSTWDDVPGCSLRCLARGDYAYGHIYIDGNIFEGGEDGWIREYFWNSILGIF